jgi:hypothetical protein
VNKNDSCPGFQEIVEPVLEALMNRGTRVKMNYLNLWQLDLCGPRIIAKYVVERLLMRFRRSADYGKDMTVTVLAHITSILINEFTCRLHLYHQKDLRI